MFGVFRVKNPDFTPKNLIFSNFKGRPSLDPSLRRTAFKMTGQKLLYILTILATAVRGIYFFTRVSKYPGHMAIYRTNIVL
jgi:hypothetical protein